MVFMTTASSVAETVTAAFSGPADVPVTSAGYEAAGKDLDLSLEFTPAPGTDLTVVRNEGISFIVGQFSNIAQGAGVELQHGGITYSFVANYFGGTGNDLVLHWARRKIVAWGGGTLGHGSSAGSLVPVNVVDTGVLAGRTPISISAGASHVLVLCSDGTIAAWGNGAGGRLGDGATISRTSPVIVDRSGVLAGRTVVAVAAGDQHSMALCSDGTIASWGGNTSGQLGNGGTTASPTPVMVDGSGVLAGKTVVAISAGGSHSMALCSDGLLMSWGGNASGQLGNGTTVSSPVPLPVDASGVLASKSVVGIAAGTSASFAICSDGKAVAWGSNLYGLLGNNSTVNSAVPVAVTSTGALLGKSIVSLGTRSQSAFALCSDGTLVSWGDNDYGKLGIGNTTDQKVPVLVKTSGGLAGRSKKTVAAGSTHFLALCTDGWLASAGDNLNSQLGNGTSSSGCNVPMKVGTNRALDEVGPLAASAGVNFNVVLAGVTANSKLSGLVPDLGMLTPAISAKVSDYAITVTPATGSITLRPTSSNALAEILVNGQVVASGGTSGPVPLSPGINPVPVVVTAEDGSFTHYTVNVVRRADVEVEFRSDSDTAAVLPVFDATDLSVSLSLGFSPATGTNLKVIDNTGIGFITGRFDNLAHGQAVDLEYGGTVYHFVANYLGGTGNDLVLEWANRSVAAWGRNSDLELGYGSSGNRSVPVPVVRTGVLADQCILSVGVGTGFGMALCGDGGIASWGTMAGSGSFSGPIRATMFGGAPWKPVIAISAANRSGLALCADGTLIGGVGVFGPAFTTPGALEGKSVVAISKGGEHSLALCSDGTICSWGLNSDGQLGDGSLNTRSDVPVSVVRSGVLAGRSVIAVTTGLYHSMALCSDGTLVSWGGNGCGQLGDGTSIERNTPVEISGIGALAGKTVVGLSQGAEQHSVVLCSDGTIITWGYNNVGQLGHGSNQVLSSVPVAVTMSGALAGKKVTSVSSGYRHNIAVCSDGSVATWGFNIYGQLGDNTTTDSRVPVEVVGSGELYGKKALNGAGGMQSHVVVAEPDEGYAEWVSGHTGVTDKRPPADPDGDGIPNLMEYLLNGHPGISSMGILPTVSADGDDWVFEFTRLASSAKDTDQVFQYSGDMVNWTDVEITAPVAAGVEIGPVDGSGNQSVTVPVPKGTNARMFGRLQVVRP